MKITMNSASPADTQKVAQQFAIGMQSSGMGGLVIFLEGDLGAGKTTFSREVLRALGHKGSVKSPTYTLVEPYQIEGHPFFHFDLYRLTDPEELEFMGIRDYFTSSSCCLIEWPERGHHLLPDSDIRVLIQFQGEGRTFIFEALTTSGRKILDSLKGIQ